MRLTYCCVTLQAGWLLLYAHLRQRALASRQSGSLVQTATRKDDL